MTSNSAGPEILLEDLSGRPLRESIVNLATEVCSAQSFVITSHVNPDGDAVGSEIALGLGLRSLGKRVSVVNHHAIPDKFRPFVPEGLVTVADDEWLADAVGKFDCCVVLDTSEPARIGSLMSLVFADGQRRICMDHHLHENQGLFDQHLVVSQAPATGCLVLMLLDELGVPIDEKIARALWLALSTDTGWFRFSNATPRAFRDAARLVADGVDPELLYEDIYGSHSLARTRVLGEVLASLRTAHEGQFVWGVVSRRILEEGEVVSSELEGVIDHIRSVEGARMVALITEVGNSRFKVSLRAKGASVVEPLARQFGGGGHAKAAGFSYEGSLEDLEKELRIKTTAAVRSPVSRA